MAMKRIGLRLFPVEFHWLEMQAGKAADDLKVAEFLGSDIHQEVFAVGIFAIQALDRVLHRRCEFAVGTAELLKQHVAETRIRFVDANGVHELFDVMIHDDLGAEMREKMITNRSALSMFLLQAMTAASVAGHRADRIFRLQPRSSPLRGAQSIEKPPVSTPAAAGPASEAASAS